VEVAGGGSSTGAAAMRRRASRRATGKGWCTRRRLEGLYTRVLGLLLGKGRENTPWYGAQREDRGCPAVRRGARPVSPARRAAGSWSEGGGFPCASVRERPREGARASGRRERGPDAEVAGRDAGDAA
jgi:hypothetical protein